MYQIVTTDKFDKSFKKLDRHTQKIIKSWIEKNLMNCENPRLHGKGFTANRNGQWRYRVGNCKILADIQDNNIVLVLVDIGHRSRIY